MLTAEDRMEEKHLNRLLGLNIMSDSLDSLISRNLSLLQESFLADTVMNVGIDEERLRNIARKLNIPCEEKGFVVCVLSVQANSGPVGQKIIHILLQDSLKQSIRDLEADACFFTDSNGMLNCVVNTSDPDPRKKLETAVADARRRLRMLTDIHLFFAVGPTVDSLSRLYLSRSGAISTLLQSKASIASAERIFESGLPGKYTYSIHEKLLTLFRDNVPGEITRIIRSHINLLRSDERNGQLLSESFLFAYLKNITGECLRLGVTVERFESYVPAVVCLFQSDIMGCVDAVSKLTEQVLKHISVHRTNETNHLMSMAKDYVRDHIADERLNLEAVSNHVGLSRVYFCKLFHQMEGISFNVYLRKIRIEKAKQLLLTTNLKIFEVSSAVGFSHAKYFGQVFKNEVGQTPIEYQKCVEEKRIRGG